MSNHTKCWIKYCPLRELYITPAKPNCSMIFWFKVFDEETHTCCMDYIPHSIWNCNSQGTGTQVPVHRMCIWHEECCGAWWTSVALQQQNRDLTAEMSLWQAQEHSVAPQDPVPGKISVSSLTRFRWERTGSHGAHTFYPTLLRWYS